VPVVLRAVTLPVAGAAPDQGQLEYARQGGGAPIERRVPTHQGAAARLRHWLFRM